MKPEELITTLSALEEMGDYETDKNTTHSYLELYDQIFAPYCKDKINLLEIGNHQGGSLRLWNDYFLQAEIYGLELNVNEKLTLLDEEYENIHLTQGVDAYTLGSVNRFFGNDISFDIIIDDGSHSPHHQIFATNEYLRLLKPGGILVVEDVYNQMMAGQILMNTTSLSIHDRAVIFDRTNVKGCSDDIAIVIQRGK